MVFLIILLSITGFVLNILFWVWIYRLVFRSGTRSVYGSSTGNLFNSASYPYNMINYNDLMIFMNSLKQLEEQIHRQTNDHSIDNDFQKFYRIIQQSAKNSSGGKVKIDPTIQAKMNSQYFKMMDHMREFDQMSRMKSDLFQSNLSSMASSAGIDLNSPY